MNELKKLPFTIMSRLVIPFVMMLQVVGIVGWDSFMNYELFDFLVYCGIMIWFYIEISDIATMRFDESEEYCDVSMRNKIYFLIIAITYFIIIPLLMYYGYNLLAFMFAIIVWSSIGYINDYDFGLSVDNFISSTLISIFIFMCLDIFKGEFMILGIWGYITAFIAAVCVIVFVFGNINNPEFKVIE